MRPKYQNAHGIIFRIHSSKAADKLVHILADSGTHIIAIAKGAKKGISRKTYAIDLLNEVEVKLVPSGELELITEIKLVDSHKQFKKTLTGLLFCQLICEIVNLFVQEAEVEPAYYRNLLNMLQVTRPQKFVLLAAALILRYLYLSGHLPRLSEDVHAGREFALHEPRYPNLDIGYTARSELATGEQIPARLLKVQKFILANDFTKTQRLSITHDEELALFNLHARWLTVVAQSELKSAGMFLESFL